MLSVFWAFSIEIDFGIKHFTPLLIFVFSLWSNSLLLFDPSTNCSLSIFWPWPGFVQWPHALSPLTLHVFGQIICLAFCSHCPTGCCFSLHSLFYFLLILCFWFLTFCSIFFSLVWDFVSHLSPIDPNSITFFLSSSLLPLELEI